MGDNSILSGGWLFVIIIIILLLGGGNFLGGGNRGPDVGAVVNAAIANQSTQAGLKEILLSSANNNYETAMLIANQNLLNAQQRSSDQVNVIQGFNAIQAALSGISAQLGTCCCDIKSTLLQDKYDNAVRELTKYQTENAVKAQTEYLLGVMGKWVANAPAAA
jgi:hypothetical protein